MATDPIEFDIRERDPVDFDIAGSRVFEWDSTEYIPVVGGDAPEYLGPYEVTPRLSEQVLQTANKLMRNDVTVEGIPSYRTSNLGGGYTVIIAQD